MPTTAAATRTTSPAVYTASTSSIWLWGSGAVASALMLQTFGLIMPVFSTVFKLDPILLGWALMIPRLIDGIFDPLMGHYSDNFHTRWGRRKPFLLFSTFIGGLLLAGIWWANPAWPSYWQYIFLGLVATAYYCNWGTYAMTHGALGYELTDDYHQRARVAAVNAFFFQIVILAVGWTQAIARDPVFGGEINGFRWIGAIMGVLVIATGLIPLFACKERFANVNKINESMLTALKQTLSIRPFRTYLAMRFFWAFGTIVFNQLIFFVNVYHVCGGDKGLATKIIGIGTTITVALTFALLPLSARISKLIGKRQCLILGVLIVVLQAVSVPILYQPSMPYLQLVSAALFAPAIALANVFREAIVPDICDIDELNYEQRREALFNSVMSFVYKLEVSLCIVLSGYLISWSGFDAKAESQPASVLTNLQWFAYAPNLVFAAIALILAVRFPITEAQMEIVRQKLEIQRARRPVEATLPKLPSQSDESPQEAIRDERQPSS
jgi:glycoside/pentoside/hexuronide:cation symporter, GPH family